MHAQRKLADRTVVASLTGCVTVSAGTMPIALADLAAGGDVWLSRIGSGLVCGGSTIAYTRSGPNDSVPDAGTWAATASGEELGLLIRGGYSPDISRVEAGQSR